MRLRSVRFQSQRSLSKTLDFQNRLSRCFYLKLIRTALACGIHNIIQSSLYSTISNVNWSQASQRRHPSISLSNSVRRAGSTKLRGIFPRLLPKRNGREAHLINTRTHTRNKHDNSKRHTSVLLTIQQVLVFVQKQKAFAEFKKVLFRD